MMQEGTMRRYFLGMGIGVLAALVPAIAQEQSKPPMGGFPDLVAGLKATQGCLGVETAQSSSGKNVIFAWFEDKKAAIRWYSSAMHQQVMKLGGPLPADHPAPLAGVAADSGPIMVIASLTMSKDPAARNSPLPVSHIAIALASWPGRSGPFWTARASAGGEVGAGCGRADALGAPSARAPPRPPRPPRPPPPPLPNPKPTGFSAPPSISIAAT